MPMGPVHFSPGGYFNGRNIRIYFSTATHYNFDQEDLIETYLRKIHAGENPKRILEIGTGIGCVFFFRFCFVKQQ